MGQLASDFIPNISAQDLNQYARREAPSGEAANA